MVSSHYRINSFVTHRGRHIIYTNINGNDGVDIRDVSRESLHNTVGMVLQDTWIFTGTITEQGTHHELIKRGGHYKELYENYVAGISI